MYYVNKIGGSILGNTKLLKNIIQITKKDVANNIKPYFVVSALNISTDKNEGTTTTLSKLYNTNNSFEKSKYTQKIITDHEKICNELNINSKYLMDEFTQITKSNNFKHFDDFIKIGENMATIIFSKYLINNNLNSSPYNFFKKYNLNNLHLQKNRNNLTSTIKKDISLFENNDIVPVFSGFINSNNNNMMELFGRGYTDTTGAIIANTINACKYKIWKETGGVFTGHPYKIKDPKLIKNLSINEAIQLTAYGNDVLHPLTSQFAKDTLLNVSIIDANINRNSNTNIYYNQTGQQNQTHNKVTAICSKNNLTIIQKNFNIITNVNIDCYLKHNPILLTINNNCFNALYHNDDFTKFLKNNYHDNIIVKNNKSIICCIGDNMKGNIGLAGQIMHTLSNVGVNIEMIYQNHEENNIMVVVSSKDEYLALKSLHKKFII